MIEIRVKSDSAQHDHDLDFLHQRQLAVEMVRAIRDLLRRGLVQRRRTADSSGNVCVFKDQAIVAMRRGCLRGEAGFVQHRIHEVSRAVAGKRTASTVRSMSARRKTEDQHTSIGIAESRDWLGPVVPVEISTALFASDLLAVSDQTRTADTSYDLLIQLRQISWRKDLKLGRRGGHCF